MVEISRADVAIQGLAHLLVLLDGTTSIERALFQARLELSNHQLGVPELRDRRKLITKRTVGVAHNGELKVNRKTTYITGGSGTGSGGSKGNQVERAMLAMIQRVRQLEQLDAMQLRGVNVKAIKSAMKGSSELAPIQESLGLKVLSVRR